MVIHANLERYRLYAGLSQSELAGISHVPVRQIRLFEKRQQNINHARAITVMRLGRALGCRSEDLLEI